MKNLCLCSFSEYFGSQTTFCQQKLVNLQDTLPGSRGNFCICYKDYCNYYNSDMQHTNINIWPIMGLVVLFVSMYLCMYFNLWHVKHT